MTKLLSLQSLYFVYNLNQLTLYVPSMIYSEKKIFLINNYFLFLHFSSHLKRLSLFTMFWELFDFWKNKFLIFHKINESLIETELNLYFFWGTIYNQLFGILFFLLNVADGYTYIKSVMPKNNGCFFLNIYRKIVKRDQIRGLFLPENTNLHNSTQILRITNIFKPKEALRSEKWLVYTDQNWHTWCFCNITKSPLRAIIRDNSLCRRQYFMFFAWDKSWKSKKTFREVQKIFSYVTSHYKRYFVLFIYFLK